MGLQFLILTATQNNPGTISETGNEPALETGLGFGVRHRASFGQVAPGLLRAIMCQEKCLHRLTTKQWRSTNGDSAQRFIQTEYAEVRSLMRTTQ